MFCIVGTHKFNGIDYLIDALLHMAIWPPLFYGVSSLVWPCFLIYPNGWFPPGETIPIKVKLGFECDDASGPFQHGLWGPSRRPQKERIVFVSGRGDHFYMSRDVKSENLLVKIFQSATIRQGIQGMLVWKALF